MAFSLIEFLTRIGIGLFVGGCIAVPIVLLLWKRKDKKIRKNIPTNMPEKIKSFRENERRCEDERNRREQVREDRRNKRAIDTIDKSTRNKLSNITGGKIIERSRSLPKTKTYPVKRTKPSSKRDWPSFE